MEQYIEEKKIVTVEILEEKTPGGNEMVKVHFDGGESEIMPKQRFELIVTEEVSDPSKTQEKVKARVGSILFGVLHEYGIKWGEVNQVADAMVLLVESGFQKASDIKWGADKLNITLNNINKVLVEDYNERRNQENNNGAASTGSGVDTENKE